MKIPNPCLSAFAHLTKDEQKLLLNPIKADILREDFALFRVICPDTGVYNFLLGHLIMKFCHELRKHSITSFARETDFKRAVEHCSIVFPDFAGSSGDGRVHDRSAGGTLPTTPSPNDRGTNAGVGDAHTNVANLASNIPSSDDKAKKRKERTVKRSAK